MSATASALRSAMLLAAGRGERMRPLTDSTPKPLVEVAGAALAEHHLRRLAAAGVQHVVVNHAHLGEQIEQRLGDGERFGLRIEYSPEPGGALETAGGIQRALPMLCAHSDSFIVVNADVFCDFDFSSLLEYELRTCDAHLVMVDTPAFKQRGDFWLGEDGLLSDADAGSASRLLTFAGISLMSHALFAGLGAGRAALRPLLVDAMRKRRVSGEYFGGRWEDVGTIERLEALRAQFD